MTKYRTIDLFLPISIILIISSIWLFNHPYKGMIHDARLYGLQALSHIYPDIFKNDIFLSYVSQENYTLFSKIHVFAIQKIGFSAANIVFFILAHFFWIISVYALSTVFYKGNLKFLSIAFVAMMPAFYGSNHIFSFGESFLTPRLFTESLVLISMYFALKDRFILCSSSLVIALLIHPIMALTGLALLSIYFFLKNRKSFFLALYCSRLWLSWLCSKSLLLMECSELWTAPGHL